MYSSHNTNKPKPDDFDTFVPWACNQLQIETSLIITKVHQNEYVSVAVTDRSKSKGKGKIKATPSQIGPSDLETVEKSDSFIPLLMARSDRVVKLDTVYDNCDRLVQIKFEKNKQIPLILIKVFGLIIQFYIHLTSVTINKGLDKYVMHELRKMLPISRITELCLDDTYLREANYYILLESPNCLKHLSLARCKLGDVGIEEIALRLIHPAPASITLCALNLSTNRITDIGANLLANALRSNRQLSYLNLAGNLITDTGAAFIFDSFKEFTITRDELLNFSSRHMDYLLKRRVLIENIVKDLRTVDLEKKAAKRKSAKLPQIGVKKPISASKTDISLKSFPEGKDFKTSLQNMEAIFYEKAEAIAIITMGEYNDPYNTQNTYMSDGVVHCYGNNTLCYLNMAYNNLTYFSIKKLLQILLYQKLLARKPIGFINVIIEGNNCPVRCPELTQIDELLEMAMIAQAKSMAGKKKPQQKNSSKW